MYYIICIIRVSVKPIRLAFFNQEIRQRTAFVSGWGRCDRTDLIDHRCLCLGDARQEVALSPCMAIPGAPMVIDARLVGILSWGFGCGYSNDLPLIYTNIKYYYPWIQHNFEILRKLSQQNFSEIFEATTAQVFVQWLVKTRSTVPVINLPALEDIVLLEIDKTLANLRGYVYDVRDFLFNGKYSKSKINAYSALRKNQKKTEKPIKTKPKIINPFLGLPFLNAFYMNNTRLSLDNGSLIETFDVSNNDTMTNEFS
ncbi:hypothetical protein ACJJTC_000915 [Scirpophaga incertulas]